MGIVPLQDAQLAIFLRKLHASFAIVLNATQDFIEVYVLQNQIQNVCHVPTRPEATKHCIFQQDNQLMQTTVNGFANLFVIHAKRFDCCFLMTLSASNMGAIVSASCQPECYINLIDSNCCVEEKKT